MQVVTLTREDAGAALEDVARARLGLPSSEEVHVRVLLEDSSDVMQRGREAIVAHIKADWKARGKDPDDVDAKVDFQADVDQVCTDESIVWEKGLDHVYGIDTRTWVMDCVDQRLRSVRVGRHAKGYNLPIVHQEPKLGEDKRGADGHRVVGSVFIKIDRRANIIVRENKGLEGPVLECEPSSRRKAEVGEGRLPTEAEVPVSTVRFDCQIIEGSVTGYLEFVDDIATVAKPGEKIMTVREYILATTDGRMLSHLAKFIAAYNIPLDPPSDG